jgi:hypothetical protein
MTIMQERRAAAAVHVLWRPQKAQLCAKKQKALEAPMACPHLSTGVLARLAHVVRLGQEAAAATVAAAVVPALFCADFDANLNLTWSL